MIDKNIFRAYDIRGISNKNLTPKIMKSIGIELRKMYPKDEFLVGNDIRSSSKKLAGALISGLKKANYSGTTSFGETLFTGLKLKKDKTLFITASHDPPNWNGLKLFNGDGDPLSSKIIYQLRDNVGKNFDKVTNDKNYLELLNNSKKVNLHKKYIEFMKNKFKLNTFKIILDCGNGATCLTGPEIFKKLELTTTIINGKVDPKFPGRSADIKNKDLKELRSKVLSKKADVGVAFDGDGDRFILVDEKGEFHRSDRIGLVLAKNMILNSNKKTVVITTSVSMAAEKELDNLNAKVIRVPVGHTYVIDTCKKKNALIGMEESGHVVLTDYFYFDDAIIPVLKILELMSKKSKKLSELMNEITEYPFEETELKCTEKSKVKFVEKMKNKFSEKYDISTVDGLKIYFKDSWVLLRASNTSPNLRLYFEANSKKRLKEIKKKFTKIFSEELKKV